MIKLMGLMLFLISGPLYSVDYTSILNKQAKEACKSEVSRTIILPHGDLHITSPLEPFSCGLNIIGDGIGSTRLIRDFDRGAFLHWTRGTDHSGGSLRNLMILAGTGTHGGIAVYIQAHADTDSSNNSYNRHSFIMEDVAIGRELVGSDWDHGIYLDGADNPDNSQGIAPGIRMTMISNTTISGTTVSQIYLNKARGANIQADCFIPLGSFHGIYIDNISQGIKIDSRTCTPKKIDNASILIMFNGIYI